MADDSLTLDRARQIATALTQVRARITHACTEAGRDRDDVRLVVVTKYFPRRDVEILQRLGVHDVAENKDQEAAAKFAALPGRDQLTVHFVGQLQSNKARSVATYADVVHSLDRAKIVSALGVAAREAHRTIDALIQVDLAPGGRAAGRGGADPVQVPDLAARIDAEPGLRLRGVMAVAPLGEDPSRAFERLRIVAETVRERFPRADWISAGMSSDLDQAIAAGATHLRVGSAILGSRASLG